MLKISRTKDGSLCCVCVREQHNGARKRDYVWNTQNVLVIGSFTLGLCFTHTLDFYQMITSQAEDLIPGGVEGEA